MSRIFGSGENSLTDAQKLNQIRIKNIERDNAIAKKQWIESQNRIMGVSTVDQSQEPIQRTKIITDQTNNISTNSTLIEDQALFNLLKITDNNKAYDIIEALDDNELSYMNINFRVIEMDLRTKSNLSVKYFIEYIKEKYDTFSNRKNPNEIDKVEKIDNIVEEAVKKGDIESLIGLTGYIKDMDRFQLKNVVDNYLNFGILDNVIFTDFMAMSENELKLIVSPRMNCNRNSEALSFSFYK
jgi:hypothetical protein